MYPAPSGLPRFARNDGGGEPPASLPGTFHHSAAPRHCEERSDVAIQGPRCIPYPLDCRASLAMTVEGATSVVAGHLPPQLRPSSLRGVQRRGNPGASVYPAPAGLPRFARNDGGGEPTASLPGTFHHSSDPRHCEERSDVAIQGPRCIRHPLDCRASLAMTVGPLDQRLLRVSRMLSNWPPSLK